MNHKSVFCGWIFVCLLSYSVIAQPAVQTNPLEARYELAGKNRTEIEQAIKQAPQEPVSYTHLTLPTILLV